MSAGRSVLLTFCVALGVSAGLRALARDNVASFDVPVVVTDPCTGEVGTGTLEVLLVVNATTGAGGPHVTVHASVHGAITGDRGSSYQVSAEGTDQSSVLADLYDVPFHGNAAGAGGAPNLSVDGTAGVHVDGSGTPIGVGVVDLSASCGR